MTSSFFLSEVAIHDGCAPKAGKRNKSMASFYQNPADSFLIYLSSPDFSLPRSKLSIEPNVSIHLCLCATVTGCCSSTASGLTSAPGFMEMTNEWACLGYGMATCNA